MTPINACLTHESWSVIEYDCPMVGSHRDAGLCVFVDGELDIEEDDE
jgi:hypothetical protein